MKIVLFGKNGQVGNELQQSLLPLGEIQALGRNDVNLENPPRLRDTLKTFAPNIIVNAAAYTAVDRAEAEVSKAYALNAEAVDVMANYARKNGALLMHYSTDYVFDGKKSGPYIETDETNPLNVYGASKRAGEEAILASQCEALIFRTSWVFSKHGNNFVKTILRLARERETLHVVADQFGAPTSAELIASITEKALMSYKKGTLKCGLYHLAASGETTWWHFAEHIIQYAKFMGVEFKLDPKQIFAIPTESYQLPAKRPQNSRMNTALLSQALGLSFPDWKTDVNHTLNFLLV